jgi:hypothetical protein
MSRGRGSTAEIRPFAEDATKLEGEANARADWEAPPAAVGLSSSGTRTVAQRPTRARAPTAAGGWARSSLKLRGEVPTPAGEGSEVEGAALIDATPIRVVLAQFRDDLKCHQQYDAEGAVAKTLQSTIRTLECALRDAEEREVFVTTARAAELSGRAESTVSRLCRDKGKLVGARKVEGSWTIEWKVFEGFIRQST